MDAVETATITPEGILDRARALRPSIAARAAETEAGRRIPPDLLHDLVEAGCFRLLRPATHHGADADLPCGLRVFEALAAADASVGWTVMIGAAGWIDLCRLPRATFDRLFGERDALIAGVFAPGGSVVPDPGGYRVTGRWGFASGCEHASWVYANGIEDVVDGVPHLRCAVLAPDEVTIEDTWHVVGLAGTGSHHFRVDDVVVPAERTFVPLLGEPCIDLPMTRLPVPSVFALGVAAVALGIACGAVHDVVELATDRVPLLAPAPLATNRLFQFDVGTADTERRAARALLYEVAEELWATAEQGEPFTDVLVARARAAAAWAAMRADEVVTTAYRDGGGAAVYDGSRLQRRLRDSSALAQHFLVRPDTLATAGSVYAGQGVDLPVF